MRRTKFPEADVMNSSAIFTSPEVIDEAEFKNAETNRTATQDTLVGKYQLDGVNTLEEMNANDQMNTDKQNPDIAGEIHINKSDLDDKAGDQIIMSEYASDEIEDAVPLVHLMTGRDTLHTVAATLDPQQFEGMPQAYVKLENDNTGGVSESQQNVFNWRHSFGTHQVNTALMNMTLEALTLSIITKTTCVSPRGLMRN